MKKAKVATRNLIINLQVIIEKAELWDQYESKRKKAEAEAKKEAFLGRKEAMENLPKVGWGI